jgi:hypothetical protein
MIADVLYVTGAGLLVGALLCLAMLGVSRSRGRE